VLPHHRDEGAVMECPGARIGPVSDGPADDFLSKAARRVRGVALLLLEMRAVAREELDLVVRRLLRSGGPVGPKQVVDGATDDRIREK